MQNTKSCAIYTAHETFVPTDDPANLPARLDRAIEKVAKLSLAGEAGDVADQLRSIVNRIQIKHVACLRFASCVSEDVTLLSALVTYSKDWQTRYFLKRYQLVDPMVAYGRTAAE